jgi:hypothetical protein
MNYLTTMIEIKTTVLIIKNFLPLYLVANQVKQGIKKFKKFSLIFYLKKTYK